MLPLLQFADLVQRFAAGARAATTQALDFTVGSVFRALAEANAAVLLWLQWLVLIVLRQTRLNTSVGAEVDSFVGDFGLSRLPAVPAEGLATFARFTASVPLLIAVGTQVRTADGAQTFQVIADPANPLWNGTGFLLPAGRLSADIIVQGIQPGSAGNIAAGTLGLLASAVAVDTVTNAAPFAGGADPETDAGVQARFPGYIDSRSRATLGAIIYAIQTARQGLFYQVQENMTPDGALLRGFFTVTVDDGTGYPPQPLLTQVGLAIEAVRPVGSSYAVLAPNVLQATIGITVAPAPGYSKASLALPVGQAILATANGGGIGQPLSYGDLYVAARGVPGVAHVSNVRLNGGIVDVGGAARQVVRATLAGVVVS